MKLMLRRDLAPALTAFIFLISTIFLTVSSRADDRNPEAHEHGVGVMNIAIQGNELEIELELPAENVVGFEHEDLTAAEKKSVQEAAAKLKKTANVIVLPKNAACELEKVEIESALLDDHDDHGKSKQHDNHGDHSEFTAHYHFECAKTGQLSYLDISLFKHFPSTHKLRVQYITSKGQGAANATQKLSRIKFN